MGRKEIDELSKIAASAIALTFVPYFEGFGLPLVEAMKCGVPIISGDKTSLPEIAGDAAIYCNPFDIESIKNRMLKLVKDEGLYNSLSSNGLTRSKLFSWDNTAKSVWDEVVLCHKQQKNNTK